MNKGIVRVVFRFFKYLLLVFVCLPGAAGFLSCGGDFQISHKPQIIIGSRGTLPTQFEKPRALAVSPADLTLAVIDKNGRVQLFDADRQYVREWRMPDYIKGTPTGCSFDGLNRLVVADTHYHRIIVFDLQGKILQQFGEYGDEPGKLIYPTDVVCDEAGNFYVTEYGLRDRVLHFSAAGEFVNEWGDHGSAPGEFQRPMSLALNDGTLYVADSCNHRLQLFDLNGGLLKVMGELGEEPGQFKYPYDIALDAEGRIYVAEFGNHRVQQLGAEGRSLAMWGDKAGREPGLFIDPWGVAIDPRGRLIVADTMNYRIQIF